MTFWETKNNDSLLSENHFLKVLNHFALKLIEANSMESIAWTIVKEAISKLDFVDCVIYYLEDGHLEQIAAHGPKNPKDFNIKNPIRIPLGHGIVGNVAKTGIAEIIDDTSLDERYIVDDSIRYSEITVPILSNDELIGIIDSEHPEKAFFQAKHLEILKIIASIASNRIMHVKANELLNQQNILLEKRVKERTLELEKTLMELKNTNKELQTFNYSLSHDLKNPLLNAISFSKLLYEEINPIQNSPLETHWKFLDSNLERLNELLNSIQRFGAVKKHLINLEKIDVQPFIEELLIDLFARKSSAEKNRITVQLNVSGYLYADKIMFYQLMQNLLLNAMKFTEKVNSSIINIEQVELENWNIIKVSDNGIGFDNKHAKDLFKLFSKFHHKEGYKGSGIGLAIVKKIMELHLGSVWAESEKGKGAVFSISFPKSKNNVLSSV